MKKEDLIAKFTELYHKSPSLIINAPGRINLIGEHTDYNEGFVLPMAINKFTTMLVSKRDDNKVKLYDLKYKESDEFELTGVKHSSVHKWSNYQRGIAKALLDVGYKIGGIDAIIFGEVPEGAGLSSSASVEIATLLSFKELYMLDMKPLEIVRLASRAENEFVGVECGIMDQFASLLSKQGYALFIDCRNLNYQYVRASFPDHSFLICNSMVKRELAASAYNERREECREALKILQRYLPWVKALRDVTIKDIEATRQYLPEKLRKRAEHVVYENERVKLAVKSLRDMNFKVFGELMNQSHKSLKELYEVSSEELDLLIKIGITHQGVFGARLTGAGFGGCVLFLLKNLSIEPLKKILTEVYQKRIGIIPQFYEVVPSEGAFVEKV